MNKALKIILPFVVLLVGGMATGLMIYFKKKVQPQDTAILPPLVKTVTAENQAYRFRVTTQGTVQPRTVIQLVPEISGRVTMVSPSLEAGGFFEKDEVLLTIDRRDFELAVTRARSQVAEADYRLSFEKAEAKVARAEWESLGEGDPNPLLLREPQLAQAQATVESAKAILEQAERDLERCEIKAPFAGRVGEESVDVGQYVSRGVSVARLYSVDQAEVRLPLSARQLAYVDIPLTYRGESQPQSSKGPRALLSASMAGQRHQWEGTIVRTEGEVDTRTRMFMAVAEVSNPYGRGQDHDRPPLSVGMFVEAEIQGREVTNVVVLPRTALRGDNQVLVVTPDLTLDIRPVQVLNADRKEVILSSGVQPGEVVCITPLDAVTKDMKVRTNQNE